MILEELIAFFFYWTRNRQWKKIFLLSAPIAILIVAGAILLVMGMLKPDKDLVRSYLTLAESELRSGDSSENAATPDEKKDVWQSTSEIDSYTGLLLRRILQIENNHRAMFLVALDLSRAGRVATARQMMRTIAPIEGDGYPAAYAWLATDQLRRKQRPTDAEKQDILVDLENASKWQDVSSNLLSLYAEILAKNGKYEEAVAKLRSKLSERPELSVKIAELAAEAKDEREYSRSSEASKKHLIEKIENGSTNPVDYLNLAKVFLLGKQVDDCAKIARAGLLVAKKTESDSANNDLVARQLSRILSESLRIKYRLTMQANEASGGMTVNLQLLDESIKADPTNPNAITDIAQLIIQGRSASPKMIATLQKSLADGTATVVTHLMLANHFLQNDNRNEAIPHLEIALRRAPNNPIVMNNLAFALLDGSKEDTEKALALVDKAMTISGKNPSMLDTKGEILEALGDYQGAIISYEDAIRILPTKLNTRRKLAAAYRKIGMAEMAEQQLKRVDEISAEIAKKNTQE